MNPWTKKKEPTPKEPKEYALLRCHHHHIRSRLCLHTFVIDFEYSVRLEGIKDRTKTIRERLKSIQKTPKMPGFYHTLKVFTYSKLVSHLLHFSSFKYKTFCK